MRLEVQLEVLLIRVLNGVYLKVELTKEDEEKAKEIAIARNKSQREGKRRDGKVMKDSLAIDIQGACAELAVSKAFNIEWDGSFFNLDKWFEWRENGHDVGGLEVRSTHYKTGSLILHPKDKDYSPFVLVLTYEKPIYNLNGWIYGFEGKKQEYWRDVGYGRPCYYCPQDQLRDIETLHEFFKSKNKTV